MFVCFTGVMPATDYLKESDLPLTSRGEVEVDEVRVAAAVSSPLPPNHYY